MGVYVNAVMVDIVCCINYIHFYLSSFHRFFESISISLPIPICFVILFYMISFFIFSLIRVRNALWEDITANIMHGWTKDDRVMIACCNDGTRPVIFKIERMDCE